MGGSQYAMVSEVPLYFHTEGLGGAKGPLTCIALSITLQAIVATTTLIAAICATTTTTTTDEWMWQALIGRGPHLLPGGFGAIAVNGVGSFEDEEATLVYLHTTGGDVHTHCLLVDQRTKCNVHSGVKGGLTVHIRPRLPISKEPNTQGGSGGGSHRTGGQEGVTQDRGTGGVTQDRGTGGGHTGQGDRTGGQEGDRTGGQEGVTQDRGTGGGHTGQGDRRGSHRTGITQDRGTGGCSTHMSVQRFPKCLSVGCSGAQHFQGSLCHPYHPHTMMDTSWTQSPLGYLKATPLSCKDQQTCMRHVW